MTEQLRPFPQNEQKHLTSFEFLNRSQPVKFAETEQVTKGVECDVYSFTGDQTKDLGIIRIQPGFKTPLQRVLQGEKTIEGHISGKGKFFVRRTSGREEIYEVNDNTKIKSEITVNIGDIMQWQAAADSYLTAYEICFPPYQEGRYETLK